MKISGVQVTVNRDGNWMPTWTREAAHGQERERERERERHVVGMRGEGRGEERMGSRGRIGMTKQSRLQQVARSPRRMEGAPPSALSKQR